MATATAKGALESDVKTTEISPESVAPRKLDESYLDSEQPSGKAPAKKADRSLLGAPVELVTPRSSSEPTSGAAPTKDASASAPTAAKKWYDAISLDAFADAYVSINSNNPTPASPNAAGVGGNSFRAYDVTNGFALGWLGVNASYAGDPVGATVSLRFGPSASIYSGTDSAIGLQFVKQAYLTLRPGGSNGKFSLDFGKFDTFVGAETADSHLNINYTRGVLYWYAQPLFHTGFRAQYDFTKALSAKLILVNGWNDTVDNNAGKTGGLQLVMKPSDAFATYVSYLVGPEQADNDKVTCAPDTTLARGKCVNAPGQPGGDFSVKVAGANGRFRHLGDVIWDITPIPELRILLNGDIGAEQVLKANGTTSYATWYGGSLAVRVAPVPIFGIGLRGEAYRDPQGKTTSVGTPTNLYTGTLTFDVAPVSFLKSMLDLRIDGANQALFSKGIDQKSKLQVTGTLGMIFKTN